MRLNWLTARQLVTPPAIWGKLPGHADFVRHGVHAGEDEAWREWLSQEWAAAGADFPVPSGQALPAAFVMPPGTLRFAPSQYVLGVIAASRDRVGRSHPLMVYQRAQLGWLQPQLLSVYSAGRRHWLFELTRCVAAHLGGRAGEHPGEQARIQPLSAAVDILWQRHRPERQATSPPASAEIATDPASGLQGVPHLPWADWPQCLTGRPARSAFWQQDAQGLFVNAAETLRQLCEVEPLCPMVDPCGVSALASDFDLRDLARIEHAPSHGPHEAAALRHLLAPDVPVRTVRGTRAVDGVLLLSDLAVALPASASASEEIDQSGGSNPPESTDLLDGLHLEFQRVVLDLTQLQVKAHWESDAPPQDAPSADFDHLAIQSAAGFQLVRDILEPRASIEEAMNSFDSQADRLPDVRNDDVLALFAPELARRAISRIPEITRREHHALSPDSPVRITPPTTP